MQRKELNKFITSICKLMKYFTLKFFPNTFFNNLMIRLYSLSCIFSKRLAHIAIVIRFKFDLPTIRILESIVYA